MNSSFRTDGTGASHGHGFGLGDTLRSIGFHSSAVSETFALGTPRARASSAKVSTARSIATPIGLDTADELRAKLAAQQDAIDRLKAELQQEKRNSLEVTGRLDKSEHAVAVLQESLVETQAQLIQMQVSLQMISTGNGSTAATTNTTEGFDVRSDGHSAMNETTTSLVTSTDDTAAETTRIVENLAILGLATRQQVTEIHEQLAPLEAANGVLDAGNIKAHEKGETAFVEGDVSDRDSESLPDVWPKVV
jgi:hypothetical protein